MIDLKNRLSELDVLLDNIDSNDWLKIPDDILLKIKENKNKDYKWEYDPSLSFEEQEIHKDTLILFLLIIYRYIANDEEKKEIDKLLNENTIQYNEKYNIDNIFKTKNTVTQDIETSETSETSLVEYKESFLQKIKEFIINFFKKRN